MLLPDRGVGTGVWLAGSAGNQQGSAPVTLLASTVAVGGGFLIASAGDENNEVTTKSGIMLVVMSPVIATVAFNLTRQYERSSASPVGTLVHVTNGQLSIGERRRSRSLRAASRRGAA